MSTFLIIIAGLGFLTFVIGALMWLVAAFRVHVLWGLASLIIPFASLIFTIRHWQEAKPGFLLNLAGVIVMMTALLLNPAVREQMVGGPASSGDRWDSIASLFAAPGGKSSQPDQTKLTTLIDEKRTQIEEAEAEFSKEKLAVAALYQKMNQQRQKLVTSDQEAVRAFNAQAAGYAQQNAALKTIQTQLQTLDEELNALLSQRSSLQASSRTPEEDLSVTPREPRGGRSSVNQVVMYTTSTCPACTMAKAYFARKGVPYREENIDRSSTAREAFEKMGGRGVPLILVGTTLIEGFSEQALDAAL